MKHWPATGLLILISLLGRPAAAQPAHAVPQLDTHRFMTTWYEIARFPVRAERRCLGDAMMLFAPGDKRNTLQLVTSCSIANGNSESWNAHGKLDASGGGKLTISRIWPFHANYWVLAIGPDYNWLLLGAPNHKQLWVLSKTTTLTDDILADIQSRAAAQGFSPAKLVKMPQHEATNIP